MNYFMRKFVLSFFICILVASIVLASVRSIPLPELVKASEAIITGRIIKTEKTEIREGVHQVICHIRMDSVLKGKPKAQDITILKKTFATVLIQFGDGKQVPSGKVIYGLGEEGIGFLSPIEGSKTALYAAGARHDLSTIAEVKNELQNKAIDSNKK